MPQAAAAPLLLLDMVILPFTVQGWLRAPQWSHQCLSSNTDDAQREDQGHSVALPCPLFLGSQTLLWEPKGEFHCAEVRAAQALTQGYFCSAP